MFLLCRVSRESPQGEDWADGQVFPEWKDEQSYAIELFVG